MTGAYANVSVLEHQILAESLRRVCMLRPLLAMILAEALASSDAELVALVAQVDVDGAEFAWRVVEGVISEVLNGLGGLPA